MRITNKNLKKIIEEELSFLLEDRHRVPKKYFSQRGGHYVAAPGQKLDYKDVQRADAAAAQLAAELKAKENEEKVRTHFTFPIPPRQHMAPDIQAAYDAAAMANIATFGAERPFIEEDWSAISGAPSEYGIPSIDEYIENQIRRQSAWVDRSPAEYENQKQNMLDKLQYGVGIPWEDIAAAQRETEEEKLTMGPLRTRGYWD
jgi:hypothetical protein